MADTTTDDLELEPKSSKMPIIIGLVLLLAGGGVGFFVTWSGIIFGHESVEEPMGDEMKDAAPKVVFIPLEPITVSLSPNSQQKHLRFRAQLEVFEKNAKEVEQNIPRVVDVLNGYLRAVEVRDIEDPAALTRLRAQMLRRVQIATGRDRINDLLIMEFVLN
ncbi:hypothetical protein ROLI_038620 [Roseobacter fucihabitans]|uniref:Flagellar protein FliL n=1 Tax=Roseobacter fucihabitans TaxID=1537242 RepID=A0ABZ2BXS9_9RHOB|nr:flagellar basal body-associated FliL family protein [Roseobacter litoralis]MBC6967316.1 Flagellar FliL protein [Roseobacter litoralis]